MSRGLGAYGTQAEECPKCGGLPPGEVTTNRGSGAAVYENGTTRADDVLICLDCGHRFLRDGSALHPHGVADGDWEALL